MGLICETNSEVCIPPMDWIADTFAGILESEYELRLVKFPHMTKTCVGTAVWPRMLLRPNIMCSILLKGDVVSGGICLRPQCR